MMTLRHGDEIIQCTCHYLVPVSARAAVWVVFWTSCTVVEHQTEHQTALLIALQFRGG
jgi:hypothetical protein